MSDIDVVEPLIGLSRRRGREPADSGGAILGRTARSPRDPARSSPGCADPDVNVRFHVIEALGRLQRDGGVRGADRDCAERRDFFLAFPAIQALARLGDPLVAPRLVPLLADELLRAPVIEALGELGDEDVVAAAGAAAERVRRADRGDRRRAGRSVRALRAPLWRRRAHRRPRPPRITATGTQNILDAVQRVGSDRLPGLAKVLGLAATATPSSAR